MIEHGHCALLEGRASKVLRVPTPEMPELDVCGHFPFHSMYLLSPGYLKTSVSQLKCLIRA